MSPKHMAFSAGGFEAAAWLGDWPIRLSVTCRGMEMKIDHRELRDLRYVLERAAAAMRAGLPEDCRHEMD